MPGETPEARAAYATAAESIVAEEGERFLEWWRSLDVVPAIDRGAALGPDAGVMAIASCAERAAQVARALMK